MPSDRPDSPTRVRGLVQAPIEPVDDSGVRAAVVGTVLFAIATVVLAVRHAALAAAGHGWYLGVAVAGTVLGAVGLAWTIHHARRVSRTATRRH
ncbi:hypothetical protein ACSDQ9_09560 [Aestuariimicrobium soli]|uniref:hypothetical protein n=1 Tax=Aestuariimicrobium soli TaxID=2035834 RepID=UPI003EB81272